MNDNIRRGGKYALREEVTNIHPDEEAASAWANKKATVGAHINCDLCNMIEKVYIASFAFFYCDRLTVDGPDGQANNSVGNE